MHGLSCHDPPGSSCGTTANDFQIEFPYLPEDSYKAKKSLFIDSPNSVNLYEVVVPPSYQNLFFIGIVELPYAPPFSKIILSRRFGILY
jgi:dimethylaniline monooxygenase (N-oxide forming)